MNLAESNEVKNLNQSEYMIYRVYNFSGALKGQRVVVWRFFGFTTALRSDDIFVQNRLGLKHQF